MLPEKGDEHHEEQRAERPAASLHEWDHAVGDRGHEDQKDCHDRQEDVDELAQQVPGSGVLQPLQLTQCKVRVGCGSPGPLPNRDLSNVDQGGEKGTTLT